MALKTGGKSITEIDEILRKIPRRQRGLFDRFYEVETSIGKMKIPEEMKAWITEKFGSAGKAERQKIIHVKNRLTGEGALFNELRASRPFDSTTREIPDLSNKNNCLFCDALKKTPSDSFGRVKGKFCVTASNVAKYDYFHGLVIFSEHNPLKLKKAWLKDYLEVSEKWFRKAGKTDSKAKHQFLMWNCLWKSGASIIHGHMQLTASRTDYGRIKHLKEVSEGYREIFGTDYFEDLFEAHSSLGLAKKLGSSKIIFYLTPAKEKEIFVLSREKSFVDLSGLIFRIIEKYKKLGVQSYNLAVFRMENYLIARLVDRGSLNNNSSDIGAMELFADSVVASDPFRLAKEF